MRQILHNLRVGCAILVVVQPLLASHAHADPILGRIGRMFHETTYHGTEPNTGSATSVECLAEHIDWLEHHIDTYGSIVAKQPDIWGEARLTKHRDEYERILYQKLTGFEYRLNASIQQSDSTFLAQALALSNAATDVPSQVETVEARTIAITSASNEVTPGANTTLIADRFGIRGADKISLEPTVELDQLSRYLQHLHELRRIGEGDDTSDSPGYSLNLVRIPVSILPGKLTREGFGAEITVSATPVVTDDLMPTTFRNLAVNDVIDMLGLPLVRTTEGLLYGKLDAVLGRRLYAAESQKIRQEFARFKSPDLALQGYLVTQVTPSVARLLNNDTVRNQLLAVIDAISKLTPQTTPLPNTPQGASPLALSPSTDIVPQTDLSFRVAANKAIQRVDARGLMSPPNGAIDPRERAKDAFSPDNLADIAKLIKDQDASKLAAALVALHVEARTPPNDPGTVLARVADEALRILVEQSTNQSQGVVPTGHARRALDPLPPSDLVPVIGLDNLVTTAEAFRPKYDGRYIRWAGGETCNEPELRVDLLDAQRFLQPQVEAAFELLRQPDHVLLYTALAESGSGLAAQLLASHSGELTADGAPGVAKYRHYFFQQLHSHPQVVVHDARGVGIEECGPGAGAPLQLAIAEADINAEARDSVEALAWAVVVESALLNERLNRDVRKLAKAKEAFDLETSRDYLFFLPDSVLDPVAGLDELAGEFQQASQLFKRYVQVRWPIHVFAVDPREQDQNVADVSLRKRELQFALALGFVSGKIGANSLTQFSRDLETQIETVSLNRTVVGFSHGADTFGWRFYPRVQALDTPCVLGALGQTIFGTSQDCDLKQRNLEEGQRECVAVVLMPSFVPYCDFDVRANWFKLTNPKNSALTMKESVRLSRAIATMRNSRAQCTQCAHLYREGEITRLMRRVEQLDRELPLQTMRALVPYENTLGGFEMFNTGVTNLAPELIGWYGAPGINIGNEFRCGCFQGCTLTGGECTGGDCGKLTQDVTSLRGEVAALSARVDATTKAATPLPACDGPGTTVFLVGRNFSVHDTKVIAGGVCIPDVRLVSREIARVTIPSCVNRVTLCEYGKTKEYVAVYLATPYGVTNHLHVPVHEEAATQNEKSEIKAAVDAGIKALKLAPRDLSIAPADPKNKTLKVVAYCLGGPQALEFRVDPLSGVKVRYAAEQDPALLGRRVSFWGAFRSGDRFLGGLVPVTTELRVCEGASFNATGGAPLERDLLAQLQAIAYPTLKASDGPVKLKLTYYAMLEGCVRPERLIEELDVEVSLVCPEGGTFGDSHPEGIPTPIEQVPSPALLLQPSGEDCGCNLGSSLGGAIGGAAAAPIKLTQFMGPPTAAASTPSLEGLSTIGAGQNGNQFDQRLSQVVEAPQRPLPTEPVAAQHQPHVPAVINVSVDATQTSGDAKRCWWDDDQHPVASRVKVRLGESWRNLRDRLPCN